MLQCGVSSGWRPAQYETPSVEVLEDRDILFRGVYLILAASPVPHPAGFWKNSGWEKKPFAFGKIC